MPVNIIATQTATLTNDVDGDGVAEAGDTISFEVTIANTGADPATGVDFGETLQGMTMTPGSINVSPLAMGDTYGAVGNATLVVDATNGVLANDVEFLGDTASVTAFDATSANGGTVLVAADGSFAYTPAEGFTGADSFTYTTIDSGGLTSTATVEVSVGPTVWFIDNTPAGAGNDGTADNPFNSIASFNAAQGTPGGPQPGDVVYLRAGTYTEADGINLTNGQTLIGQGQDLAVTPTFGGPALTLESGSAGQTPVIVVTGLGNEGVQLAQNNTIRGLDINVQHAAADGIEDGGGTVGNFTISDVSINGVGQSVDIDQGGTLNVTLDSVTSAGSTEEGIQLANIAGSVTATTVSLNGMAGDLMYGYLHAGERRLPAAGQASGATPGAMQQEAFLGAPVSIGTLAGGQQVIITWDATVDSQMHDLIYNLPNQAR